MKLTVEETGTEIEISEHEARQAHRALQHRLLELRRAAGYANVIESYGDLFALVDVGGHHVLVDPSGFAERLGLRRVAA
jgi:hypothetical protein